jgi:hypothetical protein
MMDFGQVRNIRLEGRVMENTEMVKEGFGEIVARVASAMEAAVKDYGPDAVELALLTYRISAVQELIWGGLMAATVVAIFILCRWVWVTSSEMHWSNRDLFRAATCGFGGLASVFLVIFAAGKLGSVTNWAAALGYPELLIATKALMAAGLM